MGVELSVRQAVGVILDADALRAWQKEIDPDDEYYGEEYLYEAFRDPEREGIEFGTAGSYYESKDLEHYLYFPRLSGGGDVYDLPGGIFAGPIEPGEVVTPEEHRRIVRIARAMGTEYPVVKRFTAILWH